MQVINQMFWDSSGADINYFKLRAGELYGVLSALLAVSIVAILGSLWLLYMMVNSENLFDNFKIYLDGTKNGRD